MRANAASDPNTKARLRELSNLVNEWDDLGAHRGSNGESSCGVGEVENGRRIRQAGGKWNAALKLWEVVRSKAIKLGLSMEDVARRL